MILYCPHPWNNYELRLWLFGCLVFLWLVIIDLLSAVCLENTLPAETWMCTPQPPGEDREQSLQSFTTGVRRERSCIRQNKLFPLTLSLQLICTICRWWWWSHKNWCNVYMECKICEEKYIFMYIDSTIVTHLSPINSWIFFELWFSAVPANDRYHNFNELYVYVHTYIYVVLSCL